MILATPDPRNKHNILQPAEDFLDPQVTTLLGLLFVFVYILDFVLHAAQEQGKWKFLYTQNESWTFKNTNTPLIFCFQNKSKNFKIKLFSSENKKNTFKLTIFDQLLK